MKRFILFAFQLGLFSLFSQAQIIRQFPYTDQRPRRALNEAAIQQIDTTPKRRMEASLQIDTARRSTAKMKAVRLSDTGRIKNSTLIIRETVYHKRVVRILKGQIKDELGRPVGGANLKAKSSGVTSDANGFFSIPLEDDETIGVTIPGFSTFSMDVHQQNSTWNGCSIKSDLSTEQVNQVETKETPLNVFPFPYPLPSTVYPFPATLFSKLKYFYQADSVLQMGLSGCTYRDKKYFYIPHGFALVTAMEQIHDDGTSLPEPDRWSTTIGEWNSPWDYIKALFSTPRGYYRVLVFLVTDLDASAASNQPSEEEARAWLNKGNVRLPNELSNLPLNPLYTCTLLVYHYKKTPGSDPQFIAPDPMPGEIHYTKSGLSKFIR
jgi:hypothetical protein